MRVLQIIDSLNAGGAERMAVNYANGLLDKIEFSGLVVTRNEGPLLDQLNKKVGYLFLDKKSALDLKALFSLRRFVIKNKVNIIHAHSTSFFLAFLLKLTLPSIQLIWHDHYGDSEFLSERPTLSLKIIIPFFKGIISVNHKLKDWAVKELKHKNVIYLANFPSLENETTAYTALKGIEGKRIICLANLRAQKNHFLLLEVAQKLKVSHPDWTFHLVGKDFEDDYSKQVKDVIVEKELQNSVFVYGSKNDVKNILNQSKIAILTSDSEGLPVAILEYGINKKAIVSTNVGDIFNVIEDGKNGFLVPPKNVDSFYHTLISLIDDNNLKEKFESEIFNTINNQFSKESIIENYLKWVRNEN